MNSLKSQIDILKKDLNIKESTKLSKKNYSKIEIIHIFSWLKK